MQEKNVNHKAITDVYKNAHIALQSIADLLPDVDDNSLRAELKEEYMGYDSFMNEVSQHMVKNDVEREDIGVMKKVMLWSSIKMKTLMDDSRNQIAEMMIKGTVMGINELTAMKNESENLDQEVVEFIEKLLSLEEQYEKNLREFL